MVIGITGNIGSGKSTFSKILSSMLDWKYIDMDVLAKVKGFEYRINIEKICRGFGFKRSKMDYLEFLKQNYFQKEGLKARIDEFIKPKLIIETFQHTIIESAILFEEDFVSICDAIIVVSVDDATRFSRLEAFRGMKYNAIQSRLGMQTPEKEYIDRATFIVDNSGDELSLMEQADNIRKMIYTDYARLL